MSSYQIFETTTGIFNTVDGKIFNVLTSEGGNMTLNLFKNSAEMTRVDKTSYLTAVTTLNGTLRAECSVIRPSITIAQEALPIFNYVYIPQFKRYYFVTGITSVNYGLWRIELNCDVLMTYKDGIAALSAIIGRQENDYNDNLVDNEIPTEKESAVTYLEIQNDVLNTQMTGSNVHNYVLTVVGA